MKNTLKACRAGFTLMEVMVASTITVIVMASFMAVFIHAMKLWQQEEIKNELNFNLEEALEKIRQDLRLSSLTEYERGMMAFYGATSGSYTAISIPISVDTDGDGLLQTSTNGLIEWNQTIVYHVRPGTPDKLMRTVFAPRWTNASSANVYAQLASVVAATSDAQVALSRMTGETCMSKVVFENLVALTFDTPTLGSGYDCYSATPGYTNYLWGSLVLSAGMHRVTFAVTNKNSAVTTRHKAIIDYVKCSASGSARDGELFTPTDSHPVAPYYSYSDVANTSAVSASYMGPEWVGQSALIFDMGAVTGSITLNITNDLWCDNNFNNPSYAWKSNCVPEASTNFGAIDLVFVPQKGVTWSASDSGSLATPARMENSTTVSNFMFGSTNADVGTIKLDGCWARFAFERETNSVNYSLMITNARVSDMTGTVFSNITFNGAAGVMIYPEGPASTNSDWVPMWEIAKTTNYIVSFETYETSDMDLDMFIGENSPQDIHYYGNTGTKFVYSYASVNPAFISFPVTPDIYFADIDGDGDHDLFVASQGYKFYLNQGNSRVPSFAYSAVNQPAVGCGCSYPRICVVDIDKDLDFDVLFCHPGSTQILLFRNNGTRKVPVWAASTVLINNRPTSADPSKPTPGFDITDIDGDGALDLFCGNVVDRNLSWWRNTGTVTNPVFTLQTSAYLSTNIPNIMCPCPRFVDLDADGRIDMVIGGGDTSASGDNGSVFYFHNSGTVAVPQWDAPVMIAMGSTKMANPAFINIDGAAGAWGNGPAKWEGSLGVALGATNSVSSTAVHGLSSVEVGYPRFAKMRSGIFDTLKASPIYRELTWTESVNAGCDVYVRARFSNLSDMSDADDSSWYGEGGTTNYFQNNTGNSIPSGTSFRYVQYEALLEVGKNGNTWAHTNDTPPVLRDVTVTWDWSTNSDKGSLCDLWTGLGTGPDCGIVSISIDGQSPVKGIQAKMEIYKEGRTGTNYASGIMEVWPLNTRK